MNITYIASSGNTYPLEVARIWVKDANFHSWDFDAESTKLVHGSRISLFRKQAKTYEIKLIVRGTEVERAAVLNALHDDFENDLRQLKTGRIIWGAWYCDCYIMASATSPYPDVEQFTENKISVLVPSGFWQMEEERHFDIPATPQSEFLEYPYEYPYDFAPHAVTEQTWATESPFESDFEMRIHGPCVNPRVTINGWPYLVNATVPDGQVLTINSKEHTVIMGNRNLFDARNKVQSVFQKVPAGSLTLSWEGFAFDLILFEERSEPKW